MADKIYIKQSGEKGTPVTVRIEWLPNGEIKPLMYWTPDRSCYQIIPPYRYIRLALLKEQGEGLRYKIKAKTIDPPLPYSDLRFAQHEIYLYLADNWFCGENFIDERYNHAGKEYIPVTLDVFPDGDYEPVYFWVEGLRYKVERKIKIEPRGSYYAGGIGIWHKVEARLVNADDDEDPDPFNAIRRMAAITFEVNKWFVVKK